MMDSEFWESLREKSRLIETNMNSLKRKQTGSYYTDLDLTDVMMEELVRNLDNGRKKLCEYTLLEPCVGAGNFVFSYLKAVNEKGISKKEAIVLLNNVYVADINKDALDGYRESLHKLAKIYWDIELEDSYFDTHIGSALLVDVTAQQLDYIAIDKVFPKQICEKGFDIVVTNPPYKNLKAERGHYISDEAYVNDQRKYLSISKIVSKRFVYSVHGVRNLYKLFVEEIIDRYAGENSYISLLIPASILSDKTCEKLRTHILEDAKLISVKVIGEGSGYIDAQQALCAVLIQKGKKTTAVEVTKDFCAYPDNLAIINIEDILNKHTGNAIIAISEKEYGDYKKLRKFPVVKDLKFVVNLRGELDLTANKSHIVSENTGYPLLRGRNIGYYQLINTGENEYVQPEFVERTKKREYIEYNRIICQQIANMKKERRVTFALAPSHRVLGNSCNFISVLENEYDIDIYTLLGLFNTKIINWFFKLTSSNNHINNYEIDCFPIPVESKYLREISLLTRQYLETKNTHLIDEIEELANKAYELN
jgi:Alw26I/Eco31I/Esp3I family type II restriction m6 adenine DNA methyltransferase